MKFPFLNTSTAPSLRCKSERTASGRFLFSVTPKLVYMVKEVAQMLAISQRAAYNLCNSTTEFRVLRAGGSIRIPKDSFDAWLYRAA